MSVFNTAKWLETSTDSITICKKLCPYFKERDPVKLANYLQGFGMFKEENELNRWIDHMKSAGNFTFVNKELKKLQNEWKGPDIPVFIFPSDLSNSQLRKYFKGRGGIAFTDKMLLFIPTKVNKGELQSLIIHEYHHVCRLAALSMNEREGTLIDSVVMEGLAENAVREKLGSENIAFWGNLYSDTQCERFIKTIILPNKKLSRKNKKLHHIMFGGSFYPHMMGYAAGYYLVKSYMQKSGKSTKELIGMPTNELIAT